MAPKTFIPAVIIMLLSALFFCFPPRTDAADGDPLWYEAEIESADILLSDANGGAMVVWGTNGSPKQIRAQRYDDTGNPLWGTNGKVVSDAVEAEYPAATEDGSGGVIVAWVSSGKVYIQRLNANGLKQWNSNAGVLVFTSPTADEAPVICPDGVGGAYVGLKERLAYVNRDGGVPDGVNGIEMAPYPAKFSLIADGQHGFTPFPDFTPIPGGVFTAWFDISAQVIRAQHVNGGKQWGATGALVSTRFTHMSLSTTFREIKIVRDDAGGLIVAWRGWEGSPTGGTGQVRAQRLDASGTAQWGTDGLILLNTDEVGGNLNSWWNYFMPPEIVTDGNHGAIVTWNDLRHTNVDPGDTDIYCQKVDAGGTTQWTPNGVWVIFAGDDITASGSENAPAIASDGAGGAVIAVADYYLSWNIFANRIGTDGSMIWSKFLIWDDYHSGDKANQNWPAIVFDASGPDPKGAIIAWHESDGSTGDAAEKVEISSSPPANDDSAHATTLSSQSNWTGSLYWATNDGASTCGEPGQPDVWFTYTAPSSGTLHVNTCGTNDLFGVNSGLDTVLSIHGRNPDGTLYEIACNDDAAASGCAGKDSGALRDSLTSGFVASGKTVLVRVSRYNGDTNGMYRLSWQFEPGSGGTKGDVNGDDDIDGADLSGFSTAFGTSTGEAGYDAAADFDDDGTVDETDLTGFAGVFGLAN